MRAALLLFCVICFWYVLLGLRCVRSRSIVLPFLCVFVLLLLLSFALFWCCVVFDVSFVCCVRFRLSCSAVCVYVCVIVCCLVCSFCSVLLCVEFVSFLLLCLCVCACAIYLFACSARSLVIVVPCFVCVFVLLLFCLVCCFGVCVEFVSFLIAMPLFVSVLLHSV